MLDQVRKEFEDLPNNEDKLMKIREKVYLTMQQDKEFADHLMQEYEKYKMYLPFEII